MKIRVAIIMLCIAFILFITLLIDSFSHGYSDEPVESDVIVMLGGDGGRLQKAAELYHDGYADYVLITPVIESDTYEQSAALAMDYGIPEAALILEDEATSTYTNATITMDIMENLGMTSALIVTSDYHVKRSKYIYDKLNDGGFEFTYIASFKNGEERWYEGDGAFNIWRSEYIKLWAYRMELYRWSE